MRKTIIIFALFFWNILVAGASNLAEPGPCDTLYTTDGKSFLIHHLKTAHKQIYFIMCDDEEQNLLKLPEEKVVRIKKAASAPVPEAAPVSDTAPADATEDEIEKAARKAWNFTWIGAGLTGLIGVFGLPFLITGIIKSDRVARKLRKQKGHPKEKELMKNLKMSVYGGMGLFFGVVAFYLFILFLVF